MQRSPPAQTTRIGRNKAAARPGSGAGCVPRRTSPRAAHRRARLGLQVGLAAEKLPVRVLHLGIDHSFVRGIEGVLQVQQSGDQARRAGHGPS